MENKTKLNRARTSFNRNSILVSELTYILGKERKHFSPKRNFEKDVKHPVQARRHVPHGYCITDDTFWKPRRVALDPEYSTRGGLDWSSSIRFVPAYRDENRHDELLWPELSSHARTFPGWLFAYRKDD
ncbi:hypothetical protein FGIG_09797 [Fasciola gigantica]|uniref:Uncharacterized protein n=1 Tax=Fasciola gigantica TaxID=46835 RepID=A0A504YJR1_FASGI|nr:hypothetical protein FGIG_09797 [Fasciola gigantica]